METAAPVIVFGYIRGDLNSMEMVRRQTLIEDKAAAAYSVKPDEVVIEPVVGQLQGFNRLLGALRFHLHGGSDVVVILNSRDDVGRTRWTQDWALAQLNDMRVRVEYVT